MQIYRSKIGLWAYLYLGFFLILTVYIVMEESIAGALIFIPFSAALLWAFFSTRYIITEEKLIVKPFGPAIFLKGITAIDTSSSSFFMASPALSLKRLMIKYKGGTVFVSPREPDRFIGELRQRCIHLMAQDTEPRSPSV